MGNSGSRAKNQHQQQLPPYVFPPPGYLHPPPGYPQFPQPHPYAQGQHLIQPYNYWPNQPPRKKSRKRRATTSGAPAGRAHSQSAHDTRRRDVAPQEMPQPVVPSQADSLFTPGQRLANFPAEPQHPNRRAQTPFHAPVPPPPDEDEEDEEPPPVVIPSDAGPSQMQAQHRRRHSVPLHQHEQQLPPPLAGPPPSAAFDRPLWTPSNNPLPLPPRDLFDSDAYKAVLDIPRGTDLFTALYGYQRNQVQEPGQELPQRTKSGLFGRKNSKGGGGLFRSLTGTRKQPKETPRDRVRAGDVRLVPFPVPVTRVNANDTNAQADDAAFQHAPPSQETLIPPSMPQRLVAPPPGAVGVAATPSMTGNAPFPVMAGPSAQMSNPPFPVMTAPSNASLNAPFPVMMTRAPSAPPQQPQFPPEQPLIQPTQLEPLIFTQDHPDYQGFFPHSNHRVMFQNKIYPSATHLHEALKYMESHPTIAENIRLCLNLADVYPLSAANQKHVRPDWGHKFLDFMEQVLYHKFKQHQDLRALLEATGLRPIIYSDPVDRFWGDGGGGGANELGKILEKVREILIAEGPGR